MQTDILNYLNMTLTDVPPNGDCFYNVIQLSLIQYFQQAQPKPSSPHQSAIAQHYHHTTYTHVKAHQEDHANAIPTEHGTGNKLADLIAQNKLTDDQHQPHP